nr:hypothetical protein [Candidatus Sigynarchaeum springense]
MSTRSPITQTNLYAIETVITEFGTLAAPIIQDWFNQARPIGKNRQILIDPYKTRIHRFDHFQIVCTMVMKRNDYSDSFYYDTSMADFATFFRRMNDPTTIVKTDEIESWRLIAFFLSTWGAIGRVVTDISLKVWQLHEILKILISLKQIFLNKRITALENLPSTDQDIKQLVQEMYSLDGIGPTVGPKILHLAFPEIFIPQDNAILQIFNLWPKSKNEYSDKYYDYLDLVRVLLNTYRQELTAISAIFGRRPILYVIAGLSKLCFIYPLIKPFFQVNH